MPKKIKLILAVFLLFASAGVVGLNIQFFRSGGSEKSKYEEPYAEEEALYEDDQSAEEGEPAQGDAIQTETDLVHREVFQAPLPEQDSDNAKLINPDQSPPDSKETGGPLGKEWEKSMWNELLTSFVNQKEKQQLQPHEKPVEKLIKKSAPDEKGHTDIHFFQEQVQNLRLRGIIQGKQSAAALISGRIYHQGETLEGGDIVVKEISKTHVLLQWEKGGKQWKKLLEPIGSGSRPDESEEELGEADHSDREIVQSDSSTNESKSHQKKDSP